MMDRHSPVDDNFDFSLQQQDAFILLLQSALLCGTKLVSITQLLSQLLAFGVAIFDFVSQLSSSRSTPPDVFSQKSYLWSSDESALLNHLVQRLRPLSRAAPICWIWRFRTVALCCCVSPSSCNCAAYRRSICD
jgi:hypothetical protein